jgi:hypothetical protein
MTGYLRDIPRDSPDEVYARTKEHVRDSLAAIADADDDPSTRRDDVEVWLEQHPDDPALVRVVGRIDAPARAPYLAADYEPFADVNDDLLDAAGVSRHGPE